MLVDDTFFEIVLRIIQQRQLMATAFSDLDAHCIAHFQRIGHSEHGTLLVFQYFEQGLYLVYAVAGMIR